MPGPASSHTSARSACAYCGTPLERQNIVDGAAEIRAGRLICRRCLKRESATQKAEAIARWKSRVLLIAGATIILGLGLFLVIRSQRAQARLEQAQLENERAVIDALLQHDGFSAAVGKCNELQATARDFAGTPTGENAARLAAETGQKIDAWITQRYGELTGPEREILTRLLASYPGTTASGALQLQSVHLTGATLSIRFGGLESETSSGANRNPAQEEARRFLVNVFDLFPGVSAIELQWQPASAAAESTAVHTYSVTRTQYKNLTMDGADPGNLSPTVEMGSAEH